MFKKSLLLEYLLKIAEQLKNADGKKSLSANYFFLAVLKVIRTAEDGQVPHEINNIDSQRELTAVINILSGYNMAYAQAAEDIARALSDSEYRSSMDEFMFSRMRFNAETKAKTAGLDTVDAKIYIELIMAEPTEIIKQHFIVPSSRTDEDDGDGVMSFEDFLKEIDKIKGEASAEQEADKAENESSPVDKFVEVVNSTRSIQRELLENIFGQDSAINTFASGYFQARLMSMSRKDSNKPQATFLFAGPPGVGKTYLAEKAAEALKLPYKRFDMSEYSDKEANIEFCGSDKVYKNGKAGNVTEFVAKNPRCVLLFDEIEKAHINVIHLFLQILDAGRIRDNYTDEEVSFSDAVMIFTTNVGKNLYDDPSIINLSSVPRKKVLRALAEDVDPYTGAPLFPAAICSRFASGNVIMFNHLEANNLYTIAKRELDKGARSFERATGIKINVDDRVPNAIMFAEGGKADARTVKGRANAFFYEEIYELFRLLSTNKDASVIKSLEQINVTVPVDELDDDIAKMFSSGEASEILIFAEGKLASESSKKLDGRVVCHVASTLDEAKDILFNHDISIVLCDVGCGAKQTDLQVLNAEDICSEGHDFLTYVLEKYSVPVYVLQANEGDVSQEEYLSFARLGIRGVLTAKAARNAFVSQVLEKCEIAYQQSKMFKLARENKIVSYKTSQTVSKSKKTASINLFDFRFSLMTDTSDSKSIVDNVSRPDVHFCDVIGAEDAKDELKYFVEYLKNPVKYMRKGVRSPRGVLLWGPPGTGKTLLAKAMAGESGVTFLKAEGNEFLQPLSGMGARAVHSLFDAARKYAPSIIFVDEIDAIGKNRSTSSGSDGSSDILTAFLTEMDGFVSDTSRPVFVLAATNFGIDPSQGKSLDPALLRRFDRRIYVDLPNQEERKRYLKMKAEGHPSVKLSEEQLDNIALRSTGMSLAELESVFEMALRSAIRSESGIVGDAEFEEAFETFNSGEKKEWNPDTLVRTARHEAGHALVCWLGGEKPTYLTVVARGDHGGYMQHANSEGKGIYTKRELLAKIRTSLAGRACEIAYYGDEDGISTGASGDLYTATKLAEQMICNYGMDSGAGMSYVNPSNADGSIRDKVNEILQRELDSAIEIIKNNKAAIDEIVDVLTVKNHLKENEIDDIFRRTVKS